MKSAHSEGLQRIVEVDILRGIGMFSVILIHSTILFYSQSIASFLWDTNQFAVQLLVFCSAYIYFLKEKSNSSLSFVTYFKKRILRLVQPYYIFVAVYFIILLIFQKSVLSVAFIRQSILITGGIDINWLVLLMLQFAVLFPFISFLKRKFRVGFILLLLISLLSAIWLLFYRIPVSYKAVMWLPWITMAYFGLFFATAQRSTRFLSITFAVSFIGFILLRVLEQRVGHSLQMYDNKYPPNLYFLAYGTTVVPFFMLLTRWRIFAWKPVEKYLVFLSKNSFPLYFIHSIFLFLLTKFAFQKHVDWLIFFVILLTLSSSTQYLIVILGKKMARQST